MLSSSSKEAANKAASFFCASWFYTACFYSVLFTVTGLSGCTESVRPTQLDFTSALDIPVGRSPVRGEVNAPITVIEFGDFECAACREASTTLHTLVEQYPGEVRIVYKHLPLPMHREALPAAFAAIAAGEQGKFWEFHDRVFAEQGNLAPDTYRRIAVELSLDLKRFEHDMRSEATAGRIRADIALARKLQIVSTPRIYVNGILAGGNRPSKEYEGVIEAWRSELGLETDKGSGDPPEN